MLILVDIDGVILHAHEGFGADMREDTQWKGDDALFFDRLFQDHEYLESLAGKLDFLDVLDRVLSEFDNPCTPTTFMKWWCYDLVKNTELIDWLATAPGNVVLASNQERTRRDAIVTSLAGLDFYAATYFSCDIGHAKPDPEFFQHILADQHVDPEQVWFVDDSPINVESACCLGLNGVHYQSNSQVIKELARAFA
ncbi:MAG: HAD-IA family hydrolase [Pseudomonadales bacterium]|nr:HAD-IA family hydrolase [Pseudomonadales bacterium]